MDEVENAENIALRLKNFLLSENSPIDMTEEMKEKLENLFEGYKDLSKEDQEEFRQSLTRQLADKVAGSLQSDLDGIVGHDMKRNFLFVTAIFFIFMVFVFFGYKLFKSLKDKERKRDEKKKLKQQKKKK